MTFQITFLDSKALIGYGGLSENISKPLADEIDRMQKKLSGRNETVQQAWLIIKDQEKEIERLEKMLGVRP